MKAKVISVILLLVLCTFKTNSHAAYIEYATAVSPDNLHTYSIYFSPKDTHDFNWPFLAGDKTNDINWLDAKLASEEMGGYLATITTLEEETFVQNAFAGSIRGEGIRAWIGLSDASEEGIFRWVTGPEAGQLLTYADWMSGEPNNDQYYGSEGEDYVEWRNYPYGPSGGALNDVTPNADWINTFMVEFDPSPVPEPATLFLLGSGLIGLAGWGRRKFKKNKN